MAQVETPTNARDRDDLLPAYYEFDPNEEGFIGHLLMPTRRTQKREARLRIVPRENFLAKHESKVDPKAPSPQSDFRLEASTTVLYEYRHKGFIPDSDVQDYEDSIELHEAESTRLSRILQTSYEFDVAALAQDSSQFPASGSTGHGTSNRWDVSGGTPIDDVRTAIQGIRTLHGTVANCVVMSYYTYLHIGVCSEIQEQFKYTGRELGSTQVPIDLLKQAFGVEHVLVAKGVYNSADEGQTPSIASIWDEDEVFVTKISTSRDMSMPQFGRTLRLRTDEDVPEIKSWREEDPDGEFIRAKHVMRGYRMPDPVGYRITNTKT